MITIRQGELTNCEQDFQIVYRLLCTEPVTKLYEEDLRIRVDDGNTIFIMECSDHGVIGTADIRCDAVADYTLVSLVIDQQHRGKGFGTQLLKHVEGHVFSIDVDTYDSKLKCIPGNDSFTYYHNRGYKSDGLRMVKVLDSNNAYH